MATVYPFKKYNYIVTVGDLGDMGFSEVSALDISSDPIEYREENYKHITPIKQPGLVKYGNVTLKWGITSNIDLHNWMKSIVDGGGADISKIQKNIDITLVDDVSHMELARWTIKNAWPIKYTTPDFNATANEVAIERLELAHEGVERKS